MKYVFSFLVIFIFLSSCQKELVDPTGSSGTGTGTGTGTGSGSGSSNGDLLIKSVSVTGTDTTTINLKWDSNKRLVQYISAGKTNGTSTNALVNVTREAGGNIKKIFSIPAGSSGYVDSVITYVYYQAGTSKITYIKDNNYTSVLVNYGDSILITYNSAGKISTKETYLQNFITGIYEKSMKSDYTYDAQGNLITSTISSAVTGVYMPAVTYTNTYDSHLSAFSVGDDAFAIAIIGEDAVSKNNQVKKVGIGSGVNLTFTQSQQQFNSFNRPTSGVISLTPVPPGYSISYTYFYQ